MGFHLRRQKLKHEIWKEMKKKKQKDIKKKNKVESC